MRKSFEHAPVPDADTVTVGRGCIFDMNGRVLLLQRSHQNKRNVGKWECPGGKKKPNETIEEGFLRELAKETGIHISTTVHFGEPTRRTILDGEYAGQVHEVHFTLIRVREEEVILSAEHQSYAWVHFSDLRNYDLTDETRNSLIASRPIIDLTDNSILRESSNG